jgi:DNA-binding MarR family transcriptional regulator
MVVYTTQSVQLTKKEQSLRTLRAPNSPDVAELLCACSATRRAARAVTQLYDQWLRTQKVRAPQFALLATLARRGPCNQATIARHLYLDKTTLSRNLKLLKQRRWVTHTEGRNAREVTIALTPAGRQRFLAARPVWRKAQEALKSSMDQKEWKTMWTVLRDLTRAAQSGTRRASPR